MKAIIFVLSCLLFSLSAMAGKTVRHQHKCPGIFRGMDICVNYVFPEYVKVGETISFEVQFYTWDSAYSETGVREFVDMEPIAALSAELMMAHSNGSHMAMPLKLSKIATGRYMVQNAAFTMPGQWGMSIDLQIPDYALIKRTGLYMYLYPDAQ